MELVATNNGIQHGNEVSLASRLEQLKSTRNAVQELIRDVLKDGEHYGKLPGIPKPTLYKSGAEVLLFLFRIAVRYKTDIKEFENGHREYITDCILTDSNGVQFGSSSGSCSTLESKYRYRNESDYEITGEAIPKDAKEKKREYRAQGYGMKQVNGNWEWVRFKDASKKENPDIADVYNTCLKMSQKRALTATVLTSLAVSEFFTQDLEETIEVDGEQYDRKTGEKRETTQAPSQPAKKTGSKVDFIAFLKREIKEIDSTPDQVSKELKLGDLKRRWEAKADEMPSDIQSQGLTLISESMPESVGV
jgi:hypothetical protein